MKCVVKDLNGNHCPEEPTRQIDEGVYLCDKCYRNYIQQIRYERKINAVML